MALRIADLDIKNIDDLLLAFDLLGDDLDAVARQQTGIVAGMNVLEELHRRLAFDFKQLLQQQVGADLDVAHIGTMQVLQVEIDADHLVEREAEAEIGQFRHVARLDRATGGEGVLAQFEDQRTGEVAVFIEEFEKLREEGLIAQGSQRDITEDADAAVLLGQAANNLHATEQQQVIDGGDETFGIRHGQILGRHQHAAGGITQARERFVENGFALGQGDDRLKIEIDAVGDQGFADRFDQGQGLRFLMVHCRCATQGHDRSGR